ncbi:MAG: ATP-grasp domain-containing protein [Gammaproteobacteria bacterium]|nr:ATP-grasp domain-containing protein [Gammaproteobacteria bacterium]
MRICVFEYITGGGLAGEPLPAALRREGDMMLRAVVADLAEVPGVEVTLARDARLPDPALPAKVRWIDQHYSNDLSGLLHAAAEGCEAVWPIAPETGDTLAEVCEWVLRGGRGLVASRPEVVRVAASKRATLERLRERGVPTVPSYTPRDVPFEHGGPWVVKPDDGVGCEGARIVYDRAALERACAAATPVIVQRLLPGVAGSLSLLCDEGRASTLGVNRQRVAVVEEGFRLLGCVINDPTVAEAARIEELGRGVAAALPGLWGYIGVDFILTDEGPRALEVNPRVTTSYVGLRASLGRNPAALVLDALAGARLDPLSFRGRPVTVTLETSHVA